MTAHDYTFPRVAVSVIVHKDGKILVGKRKGSHGAEEYGLPGGHLEYMETLEDCAKREVREETGIEIQHLRFFSVTNITRYAPKHYVEICFIAEWKKGKVQTCEPHNCEGWAWIKADEIPKPQFAGLPIYLKMLPPGL